MRSKEGSTMPARMRRRNIIIGESISFVWPHPVDNYEKEREGGRRRRIEVEGQIETIIALDVERAKVVSEGFSLL